MAQTGGDHGVQTVTLIAEICYARISRLILIFNKLAKNKSSYLFKIFVIVNSFNFEIIY